MKKFLAVALALCAAQSLAAHTQVAKAPRLPFMRGMGFDGYYDGRYRTWMTEQSVYSGLVAKGFDHVRLPVDFRNLASYDSSSGAVTFYTAYQSQLAWGGTTYREAHYPVSVIDTVITNAINAGLYIVLDFHGWFKIDPTDAASTNQFIALWKAVAERYKDYPNKLIFELANEPNSSDFGNVCTMQKNTIREIRKTNPTRLILFDPGDSSQPWVLTQAKNPPKFDWVSLPSGDNNIAVVVHSYNPGYFTHQGEEWKEGSSTTNVPFSAAYRSTLKWDLDQCKLYMDGTGNKLVMNEFNVGHKIATHSDITDYLSMVTRFCESNNVPWAPWIYYSDPKGGFDCFSSYGENASMYDFAEAGLFPDLVVTDKFTTNMFAKAVDITFSGYSGSTALSDFPVLVKLSEAGIYGFRYSDFKKPGGFDLCFTDANGNLLAHEIDTWNTNGVSTVWVKVPSLTSSTKIVARYGCAKPIVPKVESVWDSDYVGVWHMGEQKLPLADSSNVSRDVTSADGTGIGYGAAGIAGGAVDFGAADSSRSVNMDDHRELDGFKKLTIEAWTKQTAHAQNAGIVSKRKQIGDTISYYMFDNGSGTEMKYTADGATRVSAGVTLSPVMGQWNHQAFSLDSTASSSNSKGYLNGVNKGTASVTLSGGVYAGASELHVGNLDSFNATNFPGLVDEVRISKCVRSADWIKASYDTVADANFATYAVQGEAPSVADPADIKLKAATDKANPINYVEGETIRFDFRLDGVGECALPAELTPAYVVWERTADDGISVKGTNTISATQGFSITTSLATNGFVHIQAYLAGSDKKKYAYTDASGKTASIAFTGGAGVATEKMRLTTAEPADFQRFWRDAKAKLAAVPLDGAELVEVFPKSSATNTYRYYAAKIPCFGPHPTTGWLTVPKNAQPGTLKAKAAFDGYSVAIAQPSLPTDKPGADTMLFHVNAHGYDMVGRDAQYYTDFTTEVNGPYHPVFPGSSRPYSHGLAPQDYDNPTNAYFYYMALRVVRAFDYLKSRPEWNGADLIAEGGSQGGLQTMWAGSLVDGISKIRPYITWGCDIGNYLNATGPLLSNTWGMPNVAGAYYFDAALHAKRVPRTCVAEVTRIGMGDYTCPPRGVLLSYYNMKCAASAKLVQGSDHSDSSVPPQPNQEFTISKEVEVEPPQVSASDAPGFDYTNRVVTVSNVAAGSSLTLTATAPDGSTVSAAATVGANGQAVFYIATVPGTAYSYVVASNGGKVASGGFLAGGWDAKGSLFSAAPDGDGGSTERNGVWIAAPSGTNAEHYVVGCAADFALSQDASAATADRLVCVDASVQYGFFDKADGLPDGRIGACIGAMTAAESDGEAVWMVGTDDGWKVLFGGPAPELDTPYVLRMEADFRTATPKVRCSVSNDGGASFAVLSDALGNTWHAASRTSLAGVALDGSGLVGSIGGTLANADVAQADGVGYASLADAIAASTNSLALLTNATWPQGAPIGTIALDCAGHVLAGVSPDGSGRVVVESGYSAVPGEGRISISLAQAAQLGVATEGRTPAQVASALAANGANGIPLWKSYALGLNPADATARPRAAIAVNGETVELGLVGIAVNAGSGATVTYRVRRFSDLADIDEQLVGGAFAAGEKAEIPKADGEDRMFYRLAVDVRGY